MKDHHIREMLDHLAGLMGRSAKVQYDGINIHFVLPSGEIPARINLVAESWEVLYGWKSWWTDDLEGAFRVLEAEFLVESKKKVDITPKRLR